jgi:hypothetical protein
VTPQTLATPPPPQMFGGVHVPHVGMSAPHPSAMGPQFLPALAHVAGTQPAVPPQTLGVPPPPQVVGGAHVPHEEMSPPHPSATGPQFAPAAAHVRGVQAEPPSAPGLPQRLGMPPPPQDSGIVHVPQLGMSAPQPSAAGPQFAPCSRHVFGRHGFFPQTLGLRPPPQTSGDVHAPQSRIPPQPSGTGPQFAPIVAQLRGWQPPPSNSGGTNVDVSAAAPASSSCVGFWKTLSPTVPHAATVRPPASTTIPARTRRMGASGASPTGW